MNGQKLSRGIFVIIFWMATGARICADITLQENDKAKFQVYGFLKLDAVSQDGGVNGLTIPRYAVAGPGNTYLTVSHSRFGFKLYPAPLKGGWKLNGTLEWDLLDTTTSNQMKFRLRQAFFTLQKGASSVLLGQSWDLFSPLGPTTLMTNGYLWQVGNLGFRHSQVRYSYSAPVFEFAVAASDPASAEGMKSRTPVLQARLGAKLAETGKIQLGLSGVYGREKLENTTMGFANSVSISGLSFDWVIPFSPRFSLKGEYALGENLSYFVSRAGSFGNLAARKFEGKKVGSFWSEFLYAVPRANAWLGYSLENLTGAEQVKAGELKRTDCLLSGFQYSLGSGFSLGIEYARFFSKHLDAARVHTNQIILSSTYAF